ncbi:hypothetical protein EV361DRAFT_813739 [Lentinula raphanica]|uniref:RRM domain-containing protein n=1 Tax=Lentinula raphanica TaxID=153919 RepID=A0AA38PMA1_9AGAR|nr:hypothetical protein C8R42DRAFT_696433 [Lentinula raphanica]KAJ3763159.1 hypothetical protein EV360DRAFT_34057 [Lentinula raphanica]KAJ3769462.1 hypothetical protein FB446DRAFT_791380 [Lentinula raphanica]KAJ3830265.1 hypothetical protein F5880DRAFT_1468847 [Lentinula raphanica]KAJ3845568.1 hypothetical protein F5878DRAFT_654925 [Lentinula raphanica]
MASLAGLSASVTRILSLTGFPKELKTKDIQSAFSEWDNINGGFKIKWKDDTSLLIVFQDASTAKRAYLHTLAFPPAILTSSNGVPASIRPYDGEDAQSVIQTVNSRGQHPNPTRHNSRSASISVIPAARSVSGPMTTNGFRHNGTGSIAQHVALPEFSTDGREPSPTLPNIPSHPTLNSLISSSLGEAVSNPSPPSDPAILATSLNTDFNSLAGGPRIGDPGKRMLGAALGVRHPSLGPRAINGSGSPAPAGVDQAMNAVQRAMGGLVVAE